MNGLLTDSSDLRRRRSTNKKKSSKNKSAELKVVYISSPMKVKTCASNFRSTVQQLTGRDSDVVDRLMDEYANNDNSLSTGIVHVMDDGLFLDAGNGERIEIPEEKRSPCSSGSMPLEEVCVKGALGGDEEGFSFEEIFGAAGFLLECPLEEGVFGGMY